MNVPFRDRCKFIQNMPSKPNRYGMKIFWAFNYPVRGSRYLGKYSNCAKPAEIVCTLTCDFQGTGPNVTCGNNFIGMKLAESLANNKLTMVGIVKRNKTFLPREFQEKKALVLGMSKFLFRYNTLMQHYFRTKPSGNRTFFS